MEQYINRIINADCLDILKQLPDKCVDLVLTDPPYLHAQGGMKSTTLNCGVRSSDGDIVKKMSSFGEREIYEWLDMVDKKVKSTNVFVFSSRLQLPFYLNWAVQNKKNYDVMIWDKCHTGITNYHFLSPRYEYIVRIYTVGLYKVLDNMLYQKVQRFKGISDKIHPAQKPLKLLENLIKISSKENDLVLDCFSGSGTTAVACHNLKRRFICIEKDPEYWKASCERLEQAQRQQTLF